MCEGAAGPSIQEGKERSGMREFGWQTNKRMLAFMAQRLEDHAAVGIEIDWTMPRLVMFRLKVLFWAVGFDYAWKAAA